MTELAKLIERVEAATGPDRELDFAVARACGFWLQEQRSPGSGTIQVVIDPNDRTGRRRGRIKANFSASVDAALGLVERVLPEWSIDLYWSASGSAACIKGPLGRDGEYWSEASQPAPLAILLALLRALSARSP